MKNTKTNEFLSDLDGGEFEDKLGKTLSEVAAAVVDQGKTGKVTLTFDFKQISSSHQVTVDHKIAYVRPTSRGKLSEESTTQTPLHVGSGGALSFFPENQGQMFTKKGEPQDSGKD